MHKGADRRVRKAAFLRGVRTGALTEQVVQAVPRRRPLRTLQQIPFDRNRHYVSQLRRARKDHG